VELRRIVGEVIALYRKDGRAPPPPTSGRDFANKAQNVAALRSFNVFGPRQAWAPGTAA